MPEILHSNRRRCDAKGPLAERKQRPLSTSQLTTVNWLYLPYEIWLAILVDHRFTSRDLASLDCTCKWFKCCWGGGSVTEDAARIITKRYKRQRFGDLVNRICGETWKERLQTLEGIESRLPTLAAGSYQNIYLSPEDRLLTWGAGKFGQLGNNDLEDNTGQNIVRYVPPEAGRVVQVSAGCGHTGFVTDKGLAFTCGDNRYGQLGHTDFSGKTCKLPQRVHRGLPVGARCLQMACGSVHTILLMDSGHMYVTGLGDSGQLGLGMERRQKAAMVFTLIPFQYEDYNIVSVTAAIAHNIVVTECGKVFTFGLGSMGQLGHGGTKNLFQPTLVSVLRDKKIVSAVAGVCHSIFLDASGNTYTCGKGLGLLGHGDTHIHTVPTWVKSLQGIDIVRAAAGVAKSIFISRDGVGYWCGEGSGELKNHTALLPTVMHLPEPLHSAAIGNSHVILQMRSGGVMSMGKNGRLQTGLRSEGGSAVPRYTYLDLHTAPDDRNDT